MMLVIGGRRYQVKKVVTGGMNDNYNGYLDEDRAIISVRDTLSRQTHDETLLHEFAHALGHLGIIEHPDDDRYFNRFAQVLDAFLKQNGIAKVGWSLKLRDD